MLYPRFSYIYPPRPKNAAPVQDIPKYDNGSMVFQPKFNGSNCSIYTNGIEWKIFNRHNERLTNFNLTPEEMSSNLFKCDRGQWMFVNGEYLNKSKKDENGETFNHKLIIFDLPVFDGDYLLNSTFQERIELMDNIYGTEECEKDYLYQISDNIYRTKSYYTGYSALYNKLSVIDMIEGFVGKRKTAKLEMGTTEQNNCKSQVKFRKPTKNYQF